jgi:hypothetical protein
MIGLAAMYRLSTEVSNEPGSSYRRFCTTLWPG